MEFKQEQMKALFFFFFWSIESRIFLLLQFAHAAEHVGGGVVFSRVLKYE